MNNIYTPISITDNIKHMFKPCRLYIKELNNIKYFGKYSKEDILFYPGSGTKWKNLIKKYGKENIKTIWISDWFYCPIEIQDFALKFSQDNNIIESSDWANLCAENGLSGGSRKNDHLVEYNKLPKTSEQKRHMSISQKARYQAFPQSDETKKKRQHTLKTGPGNELLRAANLGIKCWTDGKQTIRRKDCPGLDWKRGRHR